MTSHMSAPNPAAAKALAAAITSSKQAEGAALREQRAGRLDRTRLARLATGDRRVFIRPGAPAPRHLRITVLLDASGSMLSGTPEMRRTPGDRTTFASVTEQLARNLADATTMLPNVYAEVWAHTATEGTGGVGEIFKLWQTNEPTDNVGRYSRLAFNGNLDGAALAYVIDDMLAVIKREDQGLVISISDGAPAYGQGMSFGIAHVNRVCKDARRKGLAVLSVSCAPGLSADQQRAMYGPDNFIEYNPNVRALAKSIAHAIGKAMA